MYRKIAGADTSATIVFRKSRWATPVRALTRRFLSLVLAIAVAITYPANLPIGPTSIESSGPGQASLSATRLAGHQPTIQGRKSDRAQQVPDSRTGIDQSEESDEGDDFGNPTPVAGLMVTEPLPTLISAEPKILDPRPACNSLPFEALCRLRC